MLLWCGLEKVHLNDGSNQYQQTPVSNQTRMEVTTVWLWSGKVSTEPFHVVGLFAVFFL
jgi:hypothetical protein